MATAKKAAPQRINPETKAATDISTATTKLSAAAKSVMEAVTLVEGLSEVSEDISHEIGLLKIEKKELQENLGIEKRKAKVELETAILEDENAVLNKLLANRGFITTTLVAQDALQHELQQATASTQEQVVAAVEEAKNQLHASAAAKLGSVQSAHAVELAEYKADLRSSTQEIDFLKRQVASLEATISAERQARVDIANAESQKQGTVINTTSK